MTQTIPIEAVADKTRLKISELFFSLQGEANTVGWPTVFIRLTGCPLRCNYCDTAYAFTGGQWQTLDTIITDTAAYQPQYVTVTGGEPLAQANCLVLLKRLCDVGYKVSLETSGAMDIAAVDPRVVKVMDLKTPSSDEQGRNRWENLQYITAQDQLKFVIRHRQDYDWACEAVAQYALSDKCTVLFSPVHDVLMPQTLADWILADRMPVRFQIQLHKYLWGDKPGV